MGIFREIEVEGGTTLTNSQHTKKWQVRQRTKYYGQNGIFLNIKLTIRDILDLGRSGRLSFLTALCKNAQFMSRPPVKKPKKTIPYFFLSHAWTRSQFSSFNQELLQVYGFFEFKLSPE